MKVKMTCAAVLAVVAMAAIAPSAGASATLDTLTQTNGVLSASWTSPVGSDSWQVEVATSDLRDDLGYFLDFYGAADLLPTDRSFTAPSSLPPGTYWLYVVTTPTFAICDFDFTDPACVLELSNSKSVFVPPPPPATSPPPPLLAPLSSADPVVAEGDVTVASSQDVDKLSIKISPGENVKATLSGSVSVPGASKVFKFKPVTKPVAAGLKSTKLAVKVPGKAKKAVKKALKRKKVVKAKLKLLLSDAAGNKKTLKYTVRLKP